ncbi:hypothetical protein JD844_007690 [Phrynosoma platyrhinos]|uniref:Uncharacterized protein n=1 Tax=Phrynosoma platyrhinos TaxID=52577 RepID=A0ABQ7T3P4_PHRPL|nr:hypothetical protein JD844_007690 [Phrynosoma platyrhinos]
MKQMPVNIFTVLTIMEEERDSISSACGFAKSGHRGEDSRQLLTGVLRKRELLCALEHLDPWELAETNTGINCLDSMCCFSVGETACTSLRRMLERIMGRCSPARVNRCGISLNCLCCRRFSYKLEHDEPAAIDV